MQKRVISDMFSFYDITLQPTLALVSLNYLHFNKRQIARRTPKYNI